MCSGVISKKSEIFLTFDKLSTKSQYQAGPGQEVEGDGQQRVHKQPTRLNDS